MRLRATQSAPTRVVLRWQVHVPQQQLFLGDHWERGYGDMGWLSMVPERVMPWYFLASDGETTQGYGVKTGARAFCFWQIDPQGVTLWLDVRNGGSGVHLGERTLEAATIIIDKGNEGASPFQAARSFCQKLCERHIPLAQPVYGGNNWYYAYGNSSQREILEDTRLIADLAPQGDNRPFMVIDDGWQLCNFASCNGGPWHEGNSLFPDMPGLAHKMEELGAHPGIWLRPLLTMLHVPKDWMLTVGNNTQNNGVVLDASIPEVLQHIHDDVRRIRDWGYQLIKHDFSTYDMLDKWGFQMGAQPTNDGWHFADTSRTTAEIILDLYQTIAQAAGDAVVIGCNTIGHLGAGLFAMQRTGNDTSGTEWESTRKYGVNTLAFRMPQHETFFAADADCVGLTQQIPWELNRQWLDLLARSGTPLFVSASPDAVGPEQRKALRAAFEIAAQPRPRPSHSTGNRISVLRIGYLMGRRCIMIGTDMMGCISFNAAA